jgi:hypothetical protein
MAAILPKRENNTPETGLAARGFLPYELNFIVEVVSLAILARLALGEATVLELAEPYDT